VDRINGRKREIRDRILHAAFELFVAQGVATTTINDICERADIANRTFFNHFSTRQAMMAALARQRLTEIPTVRTAATGEPVPVQIIMLFDDIAAALVKSSDYNREIVGEMLVATRYGTRDKSGLHGILVESIKQGVARGEVTTRHCPTTLADIVVGALSGSIGNWINDPTHPIVIDLHATAGALADLLRIDTHSPA